MDHRIQQELRPGRPGGTGRRWLPPLVAAGLIAAVVATAVVVSRVARDAPTSTPSTATAGQIPTPSEDQLVWTHGLLARWERIVGARRYVPIGSSEWHPEGWDFEEVGQWPDVNGKDKPSAIGLLLRQIVSGIPLATTPPADGTIRWADGTIRWADGTIRWADGTIRWAVGTAQPTEVGPAKATFDQMRTAAIRCANCPSGTFDGVTGRTLTITRASLTTMQVWTTRGRAIVPAWRFQFADSPVQVLQAAVAAPRVGPAPQNPQLMIPAARIDSAELAPDGRTLTVTYIGGGGRCGDMGRVAHAIETDHAVGIILVRRPPRDSGGACTAQGTTEQAVVQLDAPLNGRAVLETLQGTAVRVTVHQR
jgi:hypothetical protein